MKKQRQKRPDERLGKFCILAGSATAILVWIMSGLDFGQRCSAAAAVFMGLSWGLNEVAAAKKWTQKYGKPTVAEQMEMKERHSISNPLKVAVAVLGLLFVLLLFHH
jgi:hypothetical protein